MIGLLINVASFIVGIFLSVLGKPRKLQTAVWLTTAVITIGNIYVYIKEQENQPYLKLTTPNISSIDALQIIKSSYGQHLVDYDLLDVIGSYYICLKKPDTIFHSFPEWVFVFRNKRNGHLIEYKVSDSRIRPHPFVGDTSEHMKKYWQRRDSMADVHSPDEEGGYIAYYVVAKKGIYEANKMYRNFVMIFDKYGKNMIIMAGSGPEDDITETSDGITSQVLARVQIADRPTSYVNEQTEIVDPNKMLTLVIRRSDFIDENDFYQSLSPINDWKIDIDKAIETALSKGARGFPLGAERIGGPGVVRLYNGNTDSPKFCPDVSIAV